MFRPDSRFNILDFKFLEIMSNWLSIILTFAISFLLSCFLISRIKKWVRNKKRLKIDSNKIQRPRIKSLEGLITILIFIISISVILGLGIIFVNKEINIYIILSGLLTIITLAFLGYMDDIFRLPLKRIKFWILALAAIPLMTIAYDKTFITIPFWGPVSIYGFYALLIIPIILVIVSLFINAAKSFNQFTISNSLLIALTLFACAWFRDQLDGMIIFAAVIGYLVVLKDYLRVNYKISLGKTGRLTLGGIFTVGAIIGEVKLALLISIIPFIIYYIIKQIRDRRIKSEYIYIFIKKLSRPELARYLLALQIICAIMVLVLEIQRINFE